MSRKSRVFGSQFTDVSRRFPQFPFQAYAAPAAADATRDDRQPLDQPLDLQHLLRNGVLQVAEPPARRAEYLGETPIEGEGAVARWVALYDHAHKLRAALCPGDGVGARQVRRAIRSLFLYEHQLTPKTRRQARTVLWQRNRAEDLPAFAERARWARCRCPGCQTPHRIQAATRAARRAACVARSA